MGYRDSGVHIINSWFSEDLPSLELRKIEEMLGRVKDWT